MSQSGEPTDEMLMLAFARGDTKAFEQLYQRHRSWLYNTLCRQLENRSKADDVFQETWLSLLRSAARYQAKAKFSTWLYLLARQRVVDEWRATNPEVESVAFNPHGDESDESHDTRLLFAVHDERADPARQVERQQMSALLDEAVRSLPSAQREALLLAEYAEMSLEDIATLTGSSRETVKSRLRYARHRLQQLLAGAVK